MFFDGLNENSLSPNFSFIVLGEFLSLISVWFWNFSKSILFFQAWNFDDPSSLLLSFQSDAIWFEDWDMECNKVLTCQRSEMLDDDALKSLDVSKGFDDLKNLSKMSYNDDF